MKKIIYNFLDGSASIVEVSDELFAYIQKLNKEERNLSKHISFSELERMGLEPMTEQQDMDNWDFYDISNEKLKKGILGLTDNQQKLVYLIYFLGLPRSEVAKEFGVKPNVIKNRLRRILRKLKELYKQEEI